MVHCWKKDFGAQARICSMAAASVTWNVTIPNAKNAQPAIGFRAPVSWKSGPDVAQKTAASGSMFLIWAQNSSKRILKECANVACASGLTWRVKKSKSRRLPISTWAEFASIGMASRIWKAYLRRAKTPAGGTAPHEEGRETRSKHLTILF